MFPVSKYLVSPLKWILPFLFFSVSASAQQQDNNISFAYFNYSSDSSLPSLTAYSNFPSSLSSLVQNKIKGKDVLGYSKNGRPVEVYFFPGKTSATALIIGGMHGSELSSIELAENIIQKLSTGDIIPQLNVLIIPRLFPDNANCAATGYEMKLKEGAGRYSSPHAVDPNRQMPGLGQPFNPENPVDVHGRLIEKENQYLLQLIQEYKPERIANLHAIRNVQRAGIFADPRTNAEGLALGFETDSLLAVQMATAICSGGGQAEGNFSDNHCSVIYYKDPPSVPPGQFQPRNLEGSSLSGKRGAGISIGSWATTAVEYPGYAREAISLITVEFPGYTSSEFLHNSLKRFNYMLNLELYSNTILNFFLQ